MLEAILPHYRQIIYLPSDVAVISDPAVGLAVGRSVGMSEEEEEDEEGGRSQNRRGHGGHRGYGGYGGYGDHRVMGHRVNDHRVMPCPAARNASMVVYLSMLDAGPKGARQVGG